MIQPDLLDSAELPAAFVERWRELERGLGDYRPAVLEAASIHATRLGLWVIVRVDGRYVATLGTADTPTGAAEEAFQTWMRGK